jgi:hypothetical protein
VTAVLISVLIMWYGLISAAVLVMWMKLIRVYGHSYRLQIDVPFALAWPLTLPVAGAFSVHHAIQEVRRLP